jgi:hypothetical protein
MVEILLISFLALVLAISVGVAIAPRRPLLVADAYPWPFRTGEQP